MGCGTSGTAVSPPSETEVAKTGGASRKNSRSQSNSKGSRSNSRSNSRSPSRRQEPVILQTGAGKEAAEPDVTQEEPPSSAKLIVQVKRRRRTAGDAPLSEMTLSAETVEPFKPVAVHWKLHGTRATDGDWIGMYSGLAIPESVDDYTASMLASGGSKGSVTFIAPNQPGVHHFRYMSIDDYEEAASPALVIGTFDRQQMRRKSINSIHVRDAVLAESELKRVEGQPVDAELFDEPAQAVSKPPRRKRHTADGIDCTGVSTPSSKSSPKLSPKLRKSASDLKSTKPEEWHQGRLAGKGKRPKLKTGSLNDSTDSPQSGPKTAPNSPQTVLSIANLIE